MKIYIRSAAAISPQPTFKQEDLLAAPVSYNTNRLKAVEPDYKAYIDAKLSRRMSRIIRMGVAAAMQCLQDAGITMPEAIITGTAYGCLEDTGVFLTRIVEQQEEMLSPTAFIQSTHNTIGAQIALMLQCHNYNNTFTQRGHSFESALLDALLLLKEQEITQALVGSADELTDISFDILNRFGLYRPTVADSLSLLQTPAKGTIAGEGTAFFTLTTADDAANLAELEGLETFYQPTHITEVEQHIQSFLQGQQLAITDVDLLLLGSNGDAVNDAVYKQLQQSVFDSVPSAGYKHLCGEYPTATSFALWLAIQLISTRQMPQVISNQPLGSPAKRILIYNHNHFKYHSLLLVKAC